MRIIRFIKALWRYIWFGERVTIDEYVSRLNECKGCVFMDNDNWTCKKCGCYLTKKARMSTEKCPEDRW